MPSVSPLIMRFHMNVEVQPAILRATKKPAVGRLKNEVYRSREHLTPTEVDQLISAARDNRWGHRDATMLMMAFRHGLRASELCGLRWDQVHFESASLTVKRVKNGKDSTHPIQGDTMRALRKLKRECGSSEWVFMTERKGPFHRKGFAALVARAGVKAGFPFRVHPHMLRHSCGYKLANEGKDTRSLQDYLGHKNIQHTVRYTEMAPGRFKGWWD
jgi:integrase